MAHKNKTGRHQTAHQKAVSRETLLRLRKEHPEKFIRKKKVQLPPGEPTLEAKPAAPITAPAPAPEPQIKKEQQPAPLSITSPSPSPKIQSDEVLFGHEEVQPPKIESGIPSPPPTPPPGSPGTGSPATPIAPPPPEARKYAVLVWGMVVKICCGIFGEGFKPLLIKSETGEVLYDENAEGVKVWWNWLVSIGVRAFSPVVELWMFMLAYFAIRFPLIVARFRKKKPAPTTSAPQDETEKPDRQPSGKDKQEAQPSPESKEPPASPPAPQATQEERASAVETLN